MTGVQTCALPIFQQSCEKRNPQMAQAREGRQSGVAMRRLSVAALALLAVAGAQAQTSAPYPQRPVRIIVNVSAGGGVDALARIAAQHYSALWGQPFVVDNRTGAGGSIGVELVAKAAPDGYTWLMASVGTHGINLPLYTQGGGKLPYDPIKDFTPITLVEIGRAHV